MNIPTPTVALGRNVLGLCSRAYPPHLGEEFEARGLVSAFLPSFRASLKASEEVCQSNLLF